MKKEQRTKNGGLYVRTITTTDLSSLSTRGLQEVAKKTGVDFEFNDAGKETKVSAFVVVPDSNKKK